jgi:hypothetical protein
MEVSMPATAPRAFRRSAQKKAERQVTAFTLDWVSDDEEETVIRTDTFHATQPTDEQMFLVAALLGDEDRLGSEATAVLDIFRDALPANEFRVLRERIADPEDSVDMDIVSEVLEWLMEKWSTFPTKPSPGSSTSPTSTGTSSTGRVRGKGSTHSPSPSTAS